LLRRRLAVWPAAATAALFVVLELLVPKIFPDALGHTQIDVPGLPYAAALVGARGLSFFLAWMAAAIAWYPERSRRPLRLRRVELGMALAATLLLGLWGARHRTALAEAPVEHQLDVAIVQSNLGDPEEVAALLGSVTRAIDSTLTLYDSLTRAALAGRPADLVVWPETAVPTVPREPVLERLRGLVHEIDTPLVFGAYDVERIEQNRWRMYNAAYWMATTGEVRQRYYKHRLLLLGEYVPLSDRFPWLLRLLPMPGEFSPGPGPRVFEIGPVAFAPLICYELLFPRVVRRSLQAGGEVVLNLTNDYWFGPLGEPLQHLTLTRMCALETGRPIVRATNTGISALIDGGGRIVAQAELHQQTVLRGTLAIAPMRWTPFARWGDGVILAAMLLALGAVALAWRLVPAATGTVRAPSLGGSTRPEDVPASPA
jgi:apolipoprotein N-acyltransferase